MHIVSTTTLVTGVLPQVQELFDVQVPSFQVRTNRTLSLTTLIDCHRGIADDLQKRNHALALAIGSTDVRIGCSDIRPVISKTASPLRKLGIVGDALENAVQIVGNRAQVTTRQLRVQRAGVEQRWCGRSESELRQNVVKLDRAFGFVFFQQRKSHRNTHPEILGSLEATTFDVQQVTIVNCLQTKVREQSVAFSVNRVSNLFQIKFSQLRRDTLGLDTGLDVIGEVIFIQIRYILATTG